MKSCSRKILELFYNAKHSGRVMKPDAIGRVGEDDDGLVIELTWRVIDGVIEEAKFRAFGNPNAIAITSLMTDNIIGKNIEEAMQMDESVITDNLDEFRPEYIEAYDMVHAAMVEAYNNYLKRQNRKTDAEQSKYVRVEREITEEEREVGLLHQIEDEVTMVETIQAERRGRGGPRKPVDENAIVEVGEKRGRGRPRKERPEGELEVIGEKRGRGRPRKPVDENAIIVVGEKRGRGRPRKPVDENAIVEVGEKRGRGRPRKERPEGELEIIGEKRGRGRPRKIIDESEIVEAGEKRGRGRPRKPVDENAIVEVGEKRGRGRPRKERPEGELEIVGEKRGRGRPKKETLTLNKIEIIDNNQTVEEYKSETTYNSTTQLSIPNDFNTISDDETLDSLLGGNGEMAKSDDFVSNLISNKLIDEDDETFDADYNLFKSNIKNIFSGKEASSSSYGTDRVTKETFTLEQESDIDEQTETTIEVEEDEQNAIILDSSEQEVNVSEEKRGRGRPRKVVDEIEAVEESEKRGRGRPKKIVDEKVDTEHEKRGRGRPRVNPVSSLTRSLNTPGGLPLRNNTQDIVFASKNVTTTNININVTKTTTSNEDNESVNDYSKNVNITSVQQNSTLSTPVSALQTKQEIPFEEEIEIEPVQQSGIAFKDFDDYDDDNDFDDEAEELEEEIDIKDEAPKGGIEDLLKALLGD